MDPDSPDSQTCVLSPETAGPGVQNRRHRKGPRAARPPPRSAPEALPCLLGGTVVPLPSRSSPRRPRFPVKCSGLRRRVSCRSGCTYSRGARSPFYSPRAQKWKGWCPCGGAVFPGYETRIHLCENHKADRLVAAVARSTRWPDRNTVSSLSTEYPIEDDQRRMLK